MTARAKHYRNPALESEHQPHKPYDQQDAGSLILPNGSILASSDHTFLTACAPHVLALWRRSQSSPGAASRERRSKPETAVDSRTRARSGVVCSNG